MRVSDLAERSDMVHKLASLTIIAFSVAFSSLAVSDALNETARFDIPPQSVRSALIEFSKQADVQVMGSSRSFGDLKSTEVKGKLRAGKALGQLLKDTGLEFQGLRHAVVVRSLVSPNARNLPGEPGINVGAPDLGDGATDESDSEPRKEFPEPLGEMLVTGTHIRGGNAVGSRLIILNRSDIDRMGFSSAQDVVRALPQAFGGGASEDTNLGNEGNTGRGTSLNLRGLGTGSTLILMNGHRLPSTGAQAAFTDVSNIPLAAVSRIEVLTDGASAIYGSDPVGGVVNFIMRNDYQGAQTSASTGWATDGPLQEVNASQLLGTRWSSGHLTFSYEYYHRDSLPAEYRRLSADSDLRGLGGDNFSTHQSNPGTIQIGSQQYAIPHHQDGTELSQSSFTPGAVDFHNLNNRDLLGKVERQSGFLSMAQNLGASVNIFADVLYADRTNHSRLPSLTTSLTVPATNPFRVVPTGASATSPYRILYDLGADLDRRSFDVDVQTVSAALSLRIALPADWDITWSTSYASENLDQVQTGNYNTSALNSALADPNRETAFNPFGDGSFTNAQTLAGIRRSTLYLSDSSLRGLNVIANGELFALPGGSARLAMGADFREDRFRSRTLSSNSSQFSVSPAYARDASAMFAEVLLPIVSSANDVLGMDLLHLSLAARYDDYSDIKGTLNPRFGLEWSPLSSIIVHGNWGKSFKAPNLLSLDQRDNASYIAPLPDPQSATGFSSALVVVGGNAKLTPETATTWTAGIKWAPDFQSRPTLDISYFDNEFKDRIAVLPYIDRVLSDPLRYSGILNRTPTMGQRAEICGESQYAGNFGATSGDCLTAPIAAIIDARFRNTAITVTRGLDLMGTWDIDSEWGRFELSANATYLLEFSEGQTPTSPQIDSLDRVSNPLRFRFRNGLSWSKEAFGANVSVTYAGAYVDNISVPHRDVGSWTTTDLVLTYDVDSFNTGWLGGCTFSLTVHNLFDKNPPFVNNPAGVGYDRENADLLNRFVGLRLRKTW